MTGAGVLMSSQNVLLLIIEVGSIMFNVLDILWVLLLGDQPAGKPLPTEVNAEK
jgi:hypothetical protein